VIFLGGGGSIQLDKMLSIVLEGLQVKHLYQVISSSS